MIGTSRSAQPAADGAPAAARASGPMPRLERVTWKAGDPTPTGELLPDRAQLQGTQRRIYESALLLFGERGYHAVSVRDITRAVGVQASSMYAHVASKERLLADLIAIGHEEHRDHLRAAMLEAGSEPAEQLRALTRAHVEVHARYPLLTRVANRELRALREESRAEVLTVRLDSERMFFDVVERGQRLGAFTDADPMLAVAAIGAMGIRVGEWWDPELGISVEQLAETYAEFAVRLVT